jgi:hypothetical protein
LEVFGCKYKGFTGIYTIFAREILILMIVYNTTFHFNKAVADEGVAYLRKVFIPGVIAGGILLQPHLSQVMSFADEEGASFAVQFHVKDTDTLNEWLEQGGRAIHRTLIKRFGDEATGFTTLLEELDWETE